MNSVDDIIKKFLEEHPRYSAIDWDSENADLTVYFKDSSEPWGLREFRSGTSTMNELMVLESDILVFEIFGNGKNE